MTAAPPTTWVHEGDCIAWLESLAPESVDAIVTDPPYGLGFMGRAWDVLPPGKEWADACLRVLKPGGHIVAFGGTRTVHRLTCALEDAGFEIRDSIGWVYYSGFPKSLDVSKAIDAAAGAVRPVVGPSKRHVSGDPSTQRTEGLHGSSTFAETPGMGAFVTAPATVAAARWSGWGTALKPAIEPAVLARKPFSVYGGTTVAANVIRHGTGALHIDACRLAPGDVAWVGPDNGDPTQHGGRGGDNDLVGTSGRWPANLYYCPKAPRKERERGCDALPSRTGAEAVEREADSAGVRNPRAGAGRTASLVKNHHPTVKPVRVMRWLVRLVTPPRGIVIDPFLGSGTTGVAAVLEGFDFAGAERESPYVAIAEARIAHALEHPEAWAETAPGYGAGRGRT